MKIRKPNKEIQEIMSIEDITVEYDESDNRTYLSTSEIYSLGDIRMYNVYMTEKAYTGIFDEMNRLEHEHIYNESLPYRTHYQNVNSLRYIDSIDISGIFASSTIPLYSGLYSLIWKDFTYVKVEYTTLEYYHSPVNIYDQISLRLVKISDKNKNYIIPMTILEDREFDRRLESCGRVLLSESPSIIRLISHKSTLYKFYEIIGLMPFLAKTTIEINNSMEYHDSIIRLASLVSAKTIDQFKTYLSGFPERVSQFQI